jgi:hypothetical protein
MLTRLMLSGGGTAQVLIMQAGQQFITSGRYYYGYTTFSPAYGSLTPKCIEYQGTQYEISAFYTTAYGISLLVFRNSIAPPVTTIVIEVNGKKYTMVKNEDTSNFKTEVNIFTNTGTYTIKILSIE